MRRCFAVFIFLVFAGCDAQAGDLDVLDSVCLILPIPSTKEIEGIGGGTAWAYKEDQDHIYLMTAGHCVKTHKKFQVQFFTGGEEGLPVDATLVSVNYNKNTANDVLDLAVMSIKKNGLSVKPTILPLGRDDDDDLSWNEQIVTAGCPARHWPSAVLGRVENTDKDYTFLFKPNVIPGRSGSPILRRNGKTVIGVVVHYNNVTNTATGLTLKGILRHKIH